MTRSSKAALLVAAAVVGFGHAWDAFRASTPYERPKQAYEVQLKTVAAGDTPAATTATRGWPRSWQRN